MRWITESWNWIRSMRRRDALEGGLDDEIRFHIDQQTEKQRRAGMNPDEARRQALRKFGGVDRIKGSHGMKFGLRCSKTRFAISAMALASCAGRPASPQRRW